VTPQDRIGLSIAGFLGLAGSFGFLVGGHDLTLPGEPFSVMVGGALLLVTGVLALVGATVLGLAALRVLTMREWIGRTAMSACLAVAAVASFFVVAEFGSFSRNLVVVGAAVLFAAIGVISLIYLRRTTRVTVGKVGPILIGLVGTAFGVFQFWFAQQYLPTREPAALEASAVLEPVGAVAGGLKAFRATVSLKNVGKTKVIALAAAYNVSGTLSPAKEFEPAPTKVLEPFLSQSIDPYATRYSRHAGLGPAPEIVQAGRLFAENRYVEPGEQVLRQFMVFVPECRYALLRLRSQVVVAKGTLIRIRDDVIGHGAFKDTVDNTKRVGVYTQWGIKDDSWVHDILEGKEHSILINYVATAGRFDVSFFRVTAWLTKGTSKRDPQEVAEYTRRARERLGLANSFGDDEIALTSPGSAEAGAPPAC
jgi:hypothetical protein